MLQVLTAIPLLFLLAVGIGAYAAVIPISLMTGYLAVSMMTFLFYAWDKAAARSRRRRTPERFLHLLAVVGGWPGAMLAQQWLHHKTIKRRFRLFFWLSVVVNIALVVYFLRYGFL